MLPATTPPTPPSNLFLSPQSPSNSLSSLLFSDLLLRSPCSPAPANLSLSRHCFPVIAVKVSASRTRCFAAGSTAAEDQLKNDSDLQVSSEIEYEEVETRNGAKIAQDVPENSLPRASGSASSDLLSLGIPEPVYQVVEVKSDGMISTKKINRRHLLKSSGLRPRDIRSVDPSLWLTNSMPSLLVREHAILLNLGSLRAIVMQERVLVFNYNRRGGKAFIDSLLPRLSPENINGGLSMPFVLEVVEAALLSRIQRLEQRMIELEPRVSISTQ